MEAKIGEIVYGLELNISSNNPIKIRKGTLKSTRNIWPNAKFTIDVKISECTTEKAYCVLISKDLHTLKNEGKLFFKSIEEKFETEVRNKIYAEIDEDEEKEENDTYLHFISMVS